MDESAIQVIKDGIIPVLKIAEGLRLTVYPDSDSPPNPTVGWGHKCLPGDNLSMGDTITMEQAEAFFDHDLDIAILGCVTSPVIPYVAQPLPVQIALTNMAFNMGVPRLSEFVGLFTLLRAREYQAAGDHLLTLPYAAQVPSRAAQIAEQIRSAV